MYYSKEQLVLLRQEYSQLFEELSLKLQARKEMYEMLESSFKAGKIVVCGGALAIGGISIALAGHIINNVTGLNPIAINPVTGFSMIGIPGALLAEMSIAKATKEKIDTFADNLRDRLNEQIDSCNILISFFKKYQSYAMLDDVSFEQLIFQFANFYKSCIDENNFVGTKMIRELISKNEKYSKIKESDELDKALKQKRKDISLLNLIWKERNILSDGSKRIYYDSINFYNNNFTRGSYQ